MANGLPERIVKFALGQDEAFNGLFGGAMRETLSGSAGRALEARKWWAPAAVAFIDRIFGKGHCVAQAAKEAARREALAQVLPPGKP